MKASCFIVLIFLSLFFWGHLLAQGRSGLDFPYERDGLSEREAVIHLLSRFTYGYNEDDILYVEKLGLENWFVQQLEGSAVDTSLENRMHNFDDIFKSNKDLYALYPKTFRVRKEAVSEGMWSKDSVGISASSPLFVAYMLQKGYKKEKDLIDQFTAAKITRAVYASNQLREVMSDFWFNHFNVSFSKGECSTFIPNYEAFVIRPRVFGNFVDLLRATAQSPAMLYYLDNATSVVNQKNGSKGLNENYARELLELHTMGVDGGYTQQDVLNVARILTGWTVAPMKDELKQGRNEVVGKRNAGNVLRGDFLFKAANHDRGTKRVLGQTFGNNGYREGVKLLKMLAEQSATAKFICKKIAVRFVADTPSQELVDDMAATFLAKGGDIGDVLLTMVNSPDFWDKAVQRAKIKTPFELAVSAARSLRAEVQEPIKLNNWISKMGEKRFYYIAPTGFPDYAAYWINSGSLLSRMNFGLSFANEKSSGLQVDLLLPLDYREPESMGDALEKYTRKMLPLVDVEKLRTRLEPLLSVDDLGDKLVQDGKAESKKARRKQAANDKRTKTRDLAQVMGLIIGSPEFQRR